MASKINRLRRHSHNLSLAPWGPYQNITPPCLNLGALHGPAMVRSARASRTTSHSFSSHMYVCILDERCRCRHTVIRGSRRNMLTGSGHGSCMSDEPAQDHRLPSPCTLTACSVTVRCVFARFETSKNGLHFSAGVSRGVWAMNVEADIFIDN